MDGSIATRQLSNLIQQKLLLEPVFIIPPPPGLENPDFHMSLASFWQGRHNPVLVAHTSDSDSPELADAGEPELMVQEQVAYKKSRPCKGKRDRYKKLVKRLQADIQADPVTFDLNALTLPPSLQANDKQREKLLERMDRYQHRVKIDKVSENDQESTGVGQACSESFQFINSELIHL